MQDAMRASLLDEEARQMRPHGLAAGASNSRLEVAERSTTEGAEIAVDTTDEVGSEKPHPPTS